MTWNELTVWQYQQIYPILTKPNKDWSNLDIESKLVGIIYNMTDTQVDNLSVMQFNNLRSTLDFLKDEIKGEAAKYVEINGTRYRFIYDVFQIKAARYIESKVFSTDLIGNLHKIAASMVVPQRKTWYGKWVDQEYDAANHSKYADDMLEAKFVNVYNSIVFFYQVYRNWIEISKDYLVNEMTTQGLTKEQADQAVVILCEILDGSIRPRLLQTTKTSS